MQIAVRRIPPAFLLFLLLIFAAATSPSLAFTYFEQRESLIELTSQLDSSAYQTVVSLNGIWECRIGDGKAGRNVWVPGCYEGTDKPVTFHRTFLLPDSLRKFHFQLHLPEVSFGIQIWLNGRLISSVTGSHLGFVSDLAPDQLRFGSPNDITIRVVNRLTPKTTFPPRRQAAQSANYAGLFSGVFLRGVPDWSVEDVGISAESLSDTLSVRMSAHIRIAQYRRLRISEDENRSVPSAKIYVALRDSAGLLISDGASEPILQGSKDSYVVDVGMRTGAVSLWSPSHPALYSVSARLIVNGDTLHELVRRVGFDNVAVRGADLALNGKRLKIRGMDYVPDFYRGRTAAAPSLLRADLIRMRELGINTIRVPFGPPPPMLLNLADEIGMLVLIETGVSMTPGDLLVRDEYRNLARAAIEREIEELREHPCIAAWGIGSLLDWRDTRTIEFTRWISALVKTHDNRPCYVETRIPDQVAGSADFVLETWGKHGRSPNEAATSNIPVLFSRIQQAALTGDLARWDATAGLVAQSEFLTRSIIEIENVPEADGYLIHAFSDYHGFSPLTSQPLRNDVTMQSYGIVDYNRQERLAFAKLRDFAQTGLNASASASDNRASAPTAFPIVGLAALFLISVELRRNNVFRQNLKRSFLHAHGFHSDMRHRRFLHTAQPLILWLVESITLGLMTASALFSMRNSPALDYYLAHFFPSPQIKSWLIGLIWDPAIAIVVFTLFFALTIIGNAVCIRLVAMLLRKRVDLWQSLNYIVWSFAALLFLLPAAIILNRVLQMPTASEIVQIVIVLIAAWAIIRLVNALQAGFGTTSLRIWSFVLCLTALAAIIVLAVLESQIGTLTYLRFFHAAF